MEIEREIIFEEIKDPTLMSVDAQIEAMLNQYEIYNQNSVTLGIPAIDDFAGNLLSNDLMLLTAKSGVGKSETSLQLAESISSQGKKVLLVALEADDGESQLKIAYKKMSRLFFADHKDKTPPYYVDYQNWISKLVPEEFNEKYLKRAVDEYRENMKNVTLKVRGSMQFDYKNFKTLCIENGKDKDFIILDHLHFLDLEGDNENKEMKHTMKVVREIQDLIQKPILLIAHLRKTDKYNKRLTPSLEDIHGSSDIAKIATKAFIISPAKDIDGLPSYLSPTFIKMEKNRNAGGRCKYFALVNFDSRTNTYENEYILCEFDKGETGYKRTEKIPQWAKGAKREPQKIYEQPIIRSSANQQIFRGTAQDD